jgi:serine/threonine protein kinase
MGADKVTGEIVALKRINTEQEENGFPITAIREVKILKALKNENVVKLIEIVTSKGACVWSVILFHILIEKLYESFLRRTLGQLLIVWPVLD